MTLERVLVTGGTGCIGSWVVRDLVRDGAAVTVLASGGIGDRLRLVMSPEELGRVSYIDADITDPAALEAASGGGLDAIVHLAALQFPFCAADPIAGARVNVVGTVAVFELARRLGVTRLAYASSAAVYGPATRYDERVLGPDAELWPTSHYGVFKVANEQDARVFWETAGVPSVGLRPHSVYGPGRDQGVTSKPTVAMIAAAAARPYHVNFSSSAQFQFADDVARAFIAAARANLPGANLFSLGGPIVSVEEIVEAIGRVEPASRGRITFEDRTLPFPEGFDGAPVEAAIGPLPATGLDDGIGMTIETYRRAIRDGLVDEAFLDRVVAG